MAHGLESRVPLLDHPVVEFAATIPADVKFKDGRMKHILKRGNDDPAPADSQPVGQDGIPYPADRVRQE